jgi:hypothetical protein
MIEDAGNRCRLCNALSARYGNNLQQLRSSIIDRLVKNSIESFLNYWRPGADTSMGGKNNPPLAC